MHKIQAIPRTKTDKRTSRARERLNIREVKSGGDTTREPINRVSRKTHFRPLVYILFCDGAGRRGGGGVVLRRREGGRGEEAQGEDVGLGEGVQEDGGAAGGEEDDAGQGDVGGLFGRERKVGVCVCDETTGGKKRGRSAAASASTTPPLLPPKFTTTLTYQRHGFRAECEEEGRGKQTNNAGGEGDAFEGSNHVAMPALVYQDAAFLVLSFGRGSRGAKGAACNGCAGE